jgi:hypothetical protein
MPQRRTASRVLKARGSHLRHPERIRKRVHEPKFTGPLGDPPEKMRPAHRELWAELASLVPPGVAEHSDRWTFEVLVCLMAKFRERTALGGEVSQLLSLLAKFGMTPSDRSRVSAAPAPAAKSDPWSKFTPKKH